MVYVIIVVVLIVIIVPIFAVLPSARQKSQMKMRTEARRAGITVHLTSIDDPNPRQEKYISNTGRPLPPVVKVAAWRIPRPRAGNSHKLPKIDWCLKKRQSDGWQWDPHPDPLMNPALCVWLDKMVKDLPEDVEQVEEKAYTVSVYWHERSDASTDAVISFLTKIITIPLTFGGS